MEEKYQQARSRIRNLEQIVEQKDARIEELENKLAAAQKNSANSSKPPSSDIVKPPKNKDKNDKSKTKQKRKRGGQPGHPKNERKPLSPELLDEILDLKLTKCPDCGHGLVLTADTPKVTQQIEIVEKPFIAKEFRQHFYWCEHCQCYHVADLPPEVEKSGLFGTNLTALTAYMKGRCHTSYRTLKDFFSDVMGIDVSTGFLVKQIQKTSKAPKTPYEELEELLQREKHLHIDETSFKKNGKLQWAWCFVAEFFTFFKIDASRGSKVLYETLGDDFLGSVSSDFFSAYLKYKKETETLFQFCWAHLIREIRFLAKLVDTKVYGKRLLKYVKKKFETIHRQDELTKLGFKRLMNRHKRSIMATVQRHVPEYNKAAALAKRFEVHGESYFLFVENSDIAPSNNISEQEVRTLVMDRIVTQGSRSESGNEWNERFWTIMTTCRRQGLNVMNFLRTSLYNFLYGLSPPTLVPVPTKR